MAIIHITDTAEPEEYIYEECDVSSSDNEVETATTSTESVKTPIGKRLRKKSTDVRGKPKSGRIWKAVRSNRFSTIKRVSASAWKTPWEKKQHLKAEANSIKQHQQELIEQRKTERQNALQMRKEREERRKANILKAEIVQVVKNSNKIKRMKKKQLRKIEKRDTTIVDSKK